MLVGISASLVRKPVQGAREHGSALIPDDLLMVLEADPQHPVQHSRLNFDACQTYATSRLWTSANASDQSARVSPEIVVSV